MNFTAQELCWYDPAKYLPADGEAVFVSFDQGRTFEPALYRERLTSAVQDFAPPGFWTDAGRLPSTQLPTPDLWAYKESTGE